MAEGAKSRVVLDGRTLVATLSQQSGLSIEKVRAVLASLGNNAAQALKQGKLVHIPNLGTLSVRRIPRLSERDTQNETKRIVLVAAKKLRSRSF